MLWQIQNWSIKNDPNLANLGLPEIALGFGPFCVFFIFLPHFSLSTGHFFQMQTHDSTGSHQSSRLTNTHSLTEWLTPITSRLSYDANSIFFNSLPGIHLFWVYFAKINCLRFCEDFLKLREWVSGKCDPWRDVTHLTRHDTWSPFSGFHHNCPF